MAGRTVLLLAMSLDLGGAETHVVALAKALKTDGYTVSVGSQGGVLEAELTRVGIDTVHLPLHRRNPYLLRRAEHLLEDFLVDHPVDLIHAHARIPAFVADRVRRRHPVPLVTTYHSTYSPGLFLRWASRWGEAVIAVSEDIRRHLVERLGAPPELIRVIPNGLDTERFSPDGEEPAGTGPLVVHLSRLDSCRPEEPGTAVPALRLLEAWPMVLQEFPTARLVIVGGGRCQDRVAAAALALPPPVRERVELAGPRTDPEAFLRRATVVVAVGRSALEAMATAKPVLLAGEGGYRGPLGEDSLAAAERVNFTGRGSERPVTATALVTDLAGILADPRRAESLGRFGREVVLDAYSVSAMTRAVEKVYEEVWARR